ncbi:MAG: SH3 domain-containing protein [Methylophilaceae bacterium]
MKKLFIILSLLVALPALGDTGTALKADSLRAEPFSDAKTVGNISRDDKLEIMEKKGAWLKVKSAKSSGWVRLLSVKRGEASKSGSSADVLALASGRSGTGKVVSTTGVRGLSEEELKAAKFNEQEISQLESYTVNSDAARKFATSGSLSARKLEYLPDPAGTSENTQSQGIQR